MPNRFDTFYVREEMIGVSFRNNSFALFVQVKLLKVDCKNCSEMNLADSNLNKNDKMHNGCKIRRNFWVIARFSKLTFKL